MSQLSEPGHREREAGVLKRIEQLEEGAWRRSQVCGLARDDGRDSRRGAIDELDDEVVGVLRLDGVMRQYRRREIVEVSRDDGLCTGPDRGSEHVAVVRIGQCQRFE